MGLEFFKLFCAMDKDGSESIDLQEFHDYFGIPIRPFSKTVFSALGTTTKHRAITFDDFLLNVWNFGTMDDAHVRRFVFQLYDDDGDGTLDPDECASMLRMLYDVDKLDLDLQRRLKKADTDGDGQLSLDEFCAFTKKEKRLLAPAFDLQRLIRQKAISPAFWAREIERRQTSMDLTSLMAVFSRHRENVTNTRDAKAQKVQQEREKQAKEHENERALQQRMLERQHAQKERDLRAWVAAHDRPIEKEYFTAFLHRTVAQHELDLATQDRADVTIMAPLRQDIARSKYQFEQAEKALEVFWSEQERVLIDRATKDATMRAAQECATSVMQVTMKQKAKLEIELAKENCEKPLPTRTQAYERAVNKYRQELIQTAIAHVEQQIQRDPGWLRERRHEIEQNVKEWRKRRVDSSSDTTTTTMAHCYYENLITGATQWNVPDYFKCS